MLNTRLLEELEARSIPEPNSGCVLWLGNTSSGYGSFMLRGKVYAAHRLSYELTHGPIGKGKVICHKCDVSECINPAHLFAGTQGDNVRDMVAKGRQSKGEARVRALAHCIRRGEENTSAKLTDEQVIEIRSTTGSCRAVGRAYGVSGTLISMIRRGRIWRHIQ